MSLWRKWAVFLISFQFFLRNSFSHSSSRKSFTFPQVFQQNVIFKLDMFHLKFQTKVSSKLWSIHSCFHWRKKCKNYCLHWPTISPVFYLCPVCSKLCSTRLYWCRRLVTPALDRLLNAGNNSTDIIINYLTNTVNITSPQTGDASLRPLAQRR